MFPYYALTFDGSPLDFFFTKRPGLPNDLESILQTLVKSFICAKLICFIDILIFFHNTKRTSFYGKRVYECLYDIGTSACR